MKLFFTTCTDATPYKTINLPPCTDMTFNTIILFLFAASIIGFFYGLIHMYRFKIEGGIPRKMLEPQTGLSKEAITARKNALTGVGVFMVTLAIMLTLISIFGPA